MNVLFLFIYFVIILAVIEIFVILFRLTGLKVEVSRFQVISMMTGTGFTTGESELILGHPVRRKLATFLILFGAFSLAVVISSISQFLSEGLRTKEIVTCATVVLVLFVVLKLARIQQWFGDLFKRRLEDKVDLADMPLREVFLKNKEDALLNLHLYQDSPLVDQTLNQAVSGLDELDLVVLFIQRGDVMIRKDVYDTALQEGDLLLIYGMEMVLGQTFPTDISIMREKLNDQLPGVGEGMS
ncbi:hypothetical protein [Neobacillus jeddahensis]|uniref:hypothetical protein n=1 Tax=Neobacillus jeddahensis TaxID=1461580 RepID=UPI0006940279|nr:hypothetical protein [Neobacillus jeddahensis]